MSLKTELQQHMKDALKAKETVRLGVVRFLLAEIRNWEIDNNEATDEDVLRVIKRQVKQIKDGLAEFEKASRMDLVEAERAKLLVLESYLPAQLSDDELNKLVQTAVAGSSDRSMGAVMKAAQLAVAGRADGSRVSAAVKAHLAS